MADSITPKKTNLHKGHRKRLKETYIKTGIDGLPPHVILELLLFFGIPLKDTNEIAHELINKFGSLPGVLSADKESLQSVKNMTENAAILINLVSEISKMYITDSFPKKQPYDTNKKLEEYIIPQFLHSQYEKTLLVLLDKEDRIVSCHWISEGTGKASDINTAKVVKLANSANVSKVVIAHNHPDNSKTSAEDIVTAKKLAYHLDAVGIELVESFVVSEDKAFGILEHMKRK